MDHFSLYFNDWQRRFGLETIPKMDREGVSLGEICATQPPGTHFDLQHPPNQNK